uniref:Uncharacterized protein n=1 Tax=Leptocylindrus danicus TaxID=163516 RepID=A0A7S2K6I9_9STRA|mmetsp:Transcript_17815/g.26543  ORF Transcript_17815/g.26543 Transcript_17815/m.26543 type:complete len:271 (+) Transcript_17815:251-1063(+)|eukprot:CAMPEP_0116031080 /NCGR_PEP_ID=MMETSP0321-20121206/17277_1 /TAXON_ID=163516 /ORGANISM="Leptocylindrus danicus var. danicus, Strain B650" /LENGTH=270 /DNA_ID=CAMNT_0003506089 /DNA_START=231 /DNA_END=1043 /DNA_ORIENTATION=+
MSNKEEITPEESSKLFKWNLGLGLFHLLTGGAILLITDTDATVPVYSFFPDPDSRGVANDWAPLAKEQFNFPVGYLAGISILIASLDHLIVATVGRKTYESYLAGRRNPFRWIEYSLSASVMHVMVAQLSGVFDIHLLFCIFGFTMTTMIFGNLMEVLNAERDYDEPVWWAPFLYGWIPHMYGWSIILCFFFYAVVKGDPPEFVWAIIFIIFGLDTTFPIVQILQQRGKGKWENYVHGELWFCILSLTSKQLLAWLNYGGTAALNNEEPE